MKARGKEAGNTGRVRQGAVVVATACLFIFSATVKAGASPAEGKLTRDGIDLFYNIVGTTGDYVVVLSGGPGEDIRSMQGIADELGKKYRCIMCEQRGTGRSKLPKYDSSTINLNAYIEDIEALRKQLHAEKFILVGNSWGMILGLAYSGTHPNATRAVVTIGSGPITFEYLGVFSDNQIVRLGACELEARDFWKEPSREAADPDRASFERLRAATVAYFYDRKKALHMAAELNPRDYNFRVPPAFSKARGKIRHSPEAQNHHGACSSPSRPAGSRGRSEHLRSAFVNQQFDARIHRQMRTHAVAGAARANLENRGRFLNSPAHQRAVNPPSTIILCPVTNDALSEQSHKTASATSSTRPRRPIACNVARSSSFTFMP